MKDVMASLGTWTDIQESLVTADAAAADGFRKAWRTDCTTADASPSAGDSRIFTTYLEGNDLQMFKNGTSGAESYTLAFWVKCNKTGTGQVNLVNNDGARTCGASYAISSADTWEHKVLNYVAESADYPYDRDNGRALKIEWWLDSGTDFSSGTMPTTWEATTSANANAAGDLALGDNTANDWAITGIQLDVGSYTSSTLPPFQHESYVDNLMRCFRYYFKMTRDTTNQAVGMGRYWSTTSGGGMFNFPVPMRGAVTMDFVNGTSYFTASVQGENDYFDGCTQNDYGPTTSGWYMSGGGGVTTATGFICMTNNSLAVCAWKSEL